MTDTALTPAPEWLQSLLREKYPDTSVSLGMDSAQPLTLSGPVLEIVTADGIRHTLPSRPDSETEQPRDFTLNTGSIDLSGVMPVDWGTVDRLAQALEPAFEAWFKAIFVLRHPIRLNRRALQKSHERRLVKARRKLRRSLWTGHRRA